MKSLAFFNNKGGVGKTSLVYHLAWMFADLGLNVVAIDLDPQANLTSMFLGEDRLEQLWPDGEHPETILGILRPIVKGVGDITPPKLQQINDRIALIAGDLGLSTFEDRLSDAWTKCLNNDEAAFRTITSLFRAAKLAAEKTESDLVLIDVGPNLGAINRAALIGADHVVIPLAPDLFSLQGLKNLGPSLRTWRDGWEERKKKNPAKELDLPTGSMRPAGYVVMQHAVKASDSPVKAYLRWMEQIPRVYRQSVLDDLAPPATSVSNDEYCLARLKHYRSLMPMAMAARKPMFFLRPADGAIGSHIQAVRNCYTDFNMLAKVIAEAVAIEIL